MLVSAYQHNRIKNKWRNQQIHKIHNDIHYASKHYVSCDNDIIFTSKYPINQRKYRKRLENQRKRHDVYKEIAFDFDDFIFKNKNENYQRIQIRPTIYYDHNEGNIAEIFYHFYKTDHSNPFNHANKRSTNLFDKHNETKKINNSISFNEWMNNTTKKTNECQVAQKLEIDPERIWFQSLFEGNKVDIFDNKYKIWCIGTIIEVNKYKKTDKDEENIGFRFLVHYDGYNRKYDEWITNNDKIKRLHTITPNHEYILNKNKNNNNNNNNKPCKQRKYRECVLCKKRYCIKCMHQYLKQNECDECLRRIKKNEWLKGIKKADKLDVYLYGYQGAIYQHKWHCGWHIGTIIEIIKTDKKDNKHIFKIFIHFDGFEEKYNKWIDIDCSSKLIQNKIKKLNKITLIHNYLLLNDNEYKNNNKICVEIDKWKKCIFCHNKCCLKCLAPGIIIDGIGYQCNRCGIRREERNIFNNIKKSLLNIMEMNIIYIIYQYSMGITVKCCNQFKKCLNEINFNSKYEMELNAQQNIEQNKEIEIYQYYVHKNQKLNINPNVIIYNKKRRIFCKDCSKKELIKCILCNKNKEIRSTYTNNTRFKCEYCLDLIRKEKQNKEIKEIEIKISGVKPIKENICDNVDIHFKNFKDNIFPEISLKKSQTKQNIKIIREILLKYNINIDDLPYCIWSIQCKLVPNCYRKYCSFYHCDKEKELGRIISILFEKQKFDKQILKDKSRFFGGDLNEYLMDYQFNLKYSLIKMIKRRNNNISRKYNIKRETKKRQKKKAYFLRKKDKKSNVKQKKKFKRKYCLHLQY